MTDRIYADIEKMRDLATMMNILASELGTMGRRGRSVQIDRVSGSDVNVSASTGMLHSIGRRTQAGSAESCLRSLSSCLQDMEQYAERMANRINTVADEFQKTERELVNLYEGQGTGTDPYDGLSQSAAVGVLPPFITGMFDSSFLERAQIVTDGDVIGVIATGASYIFDQNGLLGVFEQKSGWTGVKETTRIYGNGHRAESEYEAGLMAAGVKLKFDAIDKSDIDSDTVAIKDGKEIKDYKKRKGDPLQILSVGASTGASVSVIAGENNWISDNQQAHVSAGLLNAEASASGVAGFGVFLPDENGNNELYLGAGAEVGISVSAAQIEASYEYELCDAVEVGVEADAELLTAEATAGAGLGIIGGELVGYVEAKAEANLVEANLEGTVNIAGVAGTAGVGVSVGVGAHAKIGLDDGVFVMDVGASLGIGVSVNIELDVGEVIENVGDALGSFVDGIGSFCGWW